MEINQNQKGSLHIPMALAVFFITFTGFQIWGLLRNWRFLVATQLRLDRCVGQVAQNFRDSLNSLDSSNLRMKEMRAARAAATLQPEIIPLLQAGLAALVLEQEIILTQWRVKQAQWLVTRGCGKIRDQAAPLPQLKFVRPPPDTLGPQPLQWSDLMPEKFEFQVTHKPRHAAAKVESDKIKNKWAAYWSPPKPTLPIPGTNFY